jgi:hypothetical protein
MCKEEIERLYKNMKNVDIDYAKLKLKWWHMSVNDKKIVARALLMSIVAVAGTYWLNSFSAGIVLAMFYMQLLGKDS